MSQRPRTRETRQRRVVYETVKATNCHPTADWIFEKVRDTIPNVSLGTVYRNLAVLRDEGLIRELYGHDRKAHYDAETSAHAHFVCSHCGAIHDVFGPLQIDWRALKELVGCRVDEQRIEFSGSCAACLHRSRNAGSGARA